MVTTVINEARTQLNQNFKASDNLCTSIIFYYYVIPVCTNKAHFCVRFMYYFPHTLSGFWHLNIFVDHKAKKAKLESSKVSSKYCVLILTSRLQLTQLFHFIHVLCHPWVFILQWIVAIPSAQSSKKTIKKKAKEGEFWPWILSVNISIFCFSFDLSQYLKSSSNKLFFWIVSSCFSGCRPQRKFLDIGNRNGIEDGKKTRLIGAESFFWFKF